ncbi:DUF2867 domain-containing protein [Streptomyces inhibens]|uniref:DUF2867 domain-containing protein n=1 Tax=Streptomyces inhibens TaxID=2293571 RepID=UPI0036B0475B
MRTWPAIWTLAGSGSTPRLPQEPISGQLHRLRAAPLTSVYLTHDEWVAELANRTVRAVMHIGWVPDGAGGYRGQMAVLVKPNGLLGAVYKHLPESGKPLSDAQS